MDDQVARRALPPLDRLPAEIRVGIFELVLSTRSGGTIRRRSKFHKGYTRCVDHALLVALVNDHHYGEACEVLYARRVVNICMHGQLRNPANGLGCGYYITYLKLANFASATVFLTKKWFALAKTLPNLKQLTVAYDGLPHTTSLREHLTNLGYKPGHRLVCVGVGKYKVRLGKGKVIYFNHFGLQERWQQISKGRRAERDRCHDMWEYALDHEPVGHLLLPAWATAFDILTWHKADSEAEGTYDEYQTRFLKEYDGHLATQKTIDSVTAAMKGGVSLLDLDKGVSCTAEILEGITDLLHVNCGRWLMLGVGDWRYLEERDYHQKLVDRLTKSNEGRSEACKRVKQGIAWIRAGLEAIKNAARRVFCYG
ncbi:hypothetical protein LTS10_008507 [Elasticomyces elasticus]|nr:hypothetical protein LTS10_008507 [Elasticomyces elasticus]